MTVATLQRNISTTIEICQNFTNFEKKEVENQRTRCQNFQKSKKIIKKKMIYSQEIIEKKNITTQ